MTKPTSNADREYVTFRLGFTKADAAKVITSMKDIVTEKPRVEDDVSVYVYLGDHLLDLVTLPDTTHAIRLPLGSTTNPSDKITVKVGCTNRLKRSTYATCHTTIGALQDAAKGHMYTAWVALESSNYNSAVSLNKANSDSKKAMSVLVYKGTQGHADLAYRNVAGDHNVVSHHDGSTYWNARADANQSPTKPYFWAGLRYCIAPNAHSGSLAHIYRAISAYFRIDKDILARLALLQASSSHADWGRLLQLLRTWAKNFEIGVDEHAITWRDHRVELDVAMRHYGERLSLCHQLKGSIVDKYRSAQKAITHTHSATSSFEVKETAESDRHCKDKQQLSRVEDECRKAENQNAQLEAKKAYIVACNEGEHQLQKERHDICIDQLNRAIDDCNDQLAFLKQRAQSVQNNTKTIKQSTAQHHDLTKALPADYKEIKDEVKENAAEHMNKYMATSEELKQVANSNKMLLSEHAQKTKELNDAQKAMEGLADQQNVLRHQWEQGLAKTKKKLADLKKACNDTLDKSRSVNAECAELKAKTDAEMKKAKLHELNNQMVGVSDLPGRQHQLTQDINAINKATRDLENQTAQVKQNWVKYYKGAIKDMNSRCEANDNAWVYEEIDNLKKQTHSTNDATVMKEIGELQKRLADIPENAMTSEALQEVIEDANEQLKEMRKRMNEKIVTYDDIIAHSNVLIAINEQCCENENEKMMLEQEIDATIVEVEYKKQILAELKTKLAKNRRRYKDLKRAIDEQDAYLFELRDKIAEKDELIDSNEEMLARKEKEIADLERMTGLKAKYSSDGKPLAVKAKPAEGKRFKAVKGDVVDELLAQLLEETGCTLPVRRIAAGKYMFGTKKISCVAKVNTLLVRVGGGYSTFQEFLKNYGDAEHDRISEAMSKGEWDEEALFQFYVGEANPHIAQQRGTVSHGRVVPTGQSLKTTVNSKALADATGRGSIGGGSPRGSPSMRSSGSYKSMTPADADATAKDASKK